MKPKFFHCVLYGFNYVYFLGWKLEDFSKYVYKKYGIEIASDDTNAGKTLHITFQGRNYILIWVLNKKNTPCFVHECVHAANFTLGSVGVQPSFKNDEAQAYLVDTIFSHGLKK